VFTEAKGGREVSTVTKPITVDEYDRMVESGAIGEDEPVELLGGELVPKMGQNPDHVWAVDYLDRTLTACASGAWHVRKEHPVRIPEFDVPEPDVAIVRGTMAALRGRHPEPAEIALITEVADTSLARDRGDKWAAYGRAGIPVYWIVNLRDRQVEVYTDPDPAGAYRSRVDYRPGQDVPVIIDGQEVGRIAVTELLP
jgi:Uma2 family endonuclease